MNIGRLRIFVSSMWNDRGLYVCSKPHCWSLGLPWFGGNSLVFYLLGKDCDDS